MKRTLKLAEWNRLKGAYGVGRRAMVQVIRRVGLGVICQVGSDRLGGVVRNREMSWVPTEQRSDLLAEGQEFEAVVIGHDNERRELQLSKKAADPNPLEAYHARHPDGTDVDGQVFRILESGALVVTLEGAVAGLMPAHQVPTARPSAEVSARWEVKVGDWVRGRKSGVNAERGQVRLDGVAAWQAAERDWAVRVDGVVTPSPPVAPPVGGLALPPVAYLTVLVVEDEPEIRGPVELYLRLRGHTVRAADSRGAAERYMATMPTLDVAVVDLQLNGDSMGSLLGRLRERFPAAIVLLLTGNSAAARPHHRFAHRVVPKPIAAPELVSLVESRGAGPVSPCPAVFDEGVTRLIANPTDDPLPSAALTLVDTHLRAVHDLYPRARVALLAYDSSRTEVRCVRAVGGSAEPFHKYGRQLVASPVEDVLGDRLPVLHIAGKGAETPGFIAFLAAVGARRLIGLQVPAEALPLPLGLFVFLPADDWGDADLFTRLNVRVDALAVALDRAVLNAQLLQNQRAMCANGLFLAITHELASGVNGVINQLGVAAGGLEGRLPLFTARPAVAAALDRANRLMGVFNDLLDTVRPRDQTAPSALWDVLRRVGEALRSTATHHGVRLVCPAAGDPRADGTAVPVVLEQAVFNLVLNAIQHTGAYRTANDLDNGLVRVTLDHEVDDGEWAVVRVTDNGPGVDGEALERVFDMFHTTRTQGSGLGLYITRSVAASCGGRAAVEQSLKFIQTTFALRLPIRKLGGPNHGGN